MNRSHLHRFSTAVVLVATCLSAPCFAGNYYVDPVNGNNVNAGTTPATAWKNVSAVRGKLNFSTDTIHLAPGVYSAASGETFPFTLYGQYLVGDQGQSATILQGGSVIFNAFNGPGSADSFASEIRGVTFRGATDAAITCTGFLALVDVTIENATNDGIRAVPTMTSEYVDIHLTRVDIHGCGTGVRCFGSPTGQSFVADHCSIRGQSQDGLSLGGAIPYTLRECTIDSNAGSGVRVPLGPRGLASLVLEDTLVSRNGQDGVSLVDAGNNGTFGLTLRRSTIANNVGRGITGNPSANATFTIALDSSIVFGHAIDYDVTLNAFGSATASHVDIGDGHFAGVNGNIALDPLFVNAASGDFRLRFGSPCIETGDAATSAGTFDLNGLARPIDGDLDTIELPDMGAFEHAPLFLVTAGHLGSPLRLELWGPSNAATVVYFSRLAPVAPTNTVFGQFDLNPASFGTLFTSTLPAISPLVFQRPIPNNPALLGRTFSFQARTNSSVAPQGSAYTNAMKVTIVP